MSSVKCFVRILIILNCITLTSCALKSRSAADIPLQLHHLYLKTPNPYSPLSVELRRMLRALHIHLAHSPKSAPITLAILKNTLHSSDSAVIFNSSYATSYTYDLMIDYQFLNREGTSLTPVNAIILSCTRLHKSNQLYIPNAEEVIRPELTQQAISIIYNKLISKTLWNALKNQKQFRKRLKS